MKSNGYGILTKTQNKKEFKNYSVKNGRRGYCMKGNIYPHKDGFQVRFGRNISKWFKYQDEAERFLTGIRYETDKGTFDPRDYHTSKPLAFNNLAEQYLKKKKKKVGRKHYNNLNNYMTRAKRVWGDANIKSLGFAEIEDLLDAQDDISGKTKANMKSCLHDFWKWLLRRKTITLEQFPEFPEVQYELGYRNITDIETQQAIIQEVKRLTYHINPKIWIGIKWLATYISMRPKEMYSLQEKDIIIDKGILFIRNPKEKSKRGPKIIELNDDDIEILKQFPTAIPQLYFFRHPKGISGCKAGQRFGEKYLYKHWKKACKNLGIENLDLYGGTRHTTATALGELLSPEQIKQGTLHSTNKAFERYFQPHARNAKLVYETIKDLQDACIQNTESEPNLKSQKVLKLAK